MKRHALFVGVDNYADPTIQNLDFPSEDAAELALVFRRQLKFDRVEKLVNPAHAPDVVDAVKGMTRELGPGDLFLFFFAGHGFRVRENHVLVCAKDEYADLEDEYAGLAVGQLKRRMRGPWNRMLVLDACQNDIRATRGADSGLTSRDLELIHAEKESDGGSGFQIVVTSCSEGQKALEVADLRHGLFTSAFLDSVTSFADRRRCLDVEALRTDIGSRMEALIAKYRLGGLQEPMFTVPSCARVILLDGADPAPPTAPSPPFSVTCPLCGRKNDPKDTFRCRVCGRDDLCLRHQDESTFLCADCATKARKEFSSEDREVREETSCPVPGSAHSVTAAGVTFNLRWISANGSRPAFWMGETQVTQQLWTAVMGNNPSKFKGNGLRPVEQVSWNDCRVFLAKLNDMDSVREAGLEFRFPTDDEWEHACRAGSTGDYCRLADGTEIMKKSLGRVAWFIETSGGMTHLVGRKEPNAWGLYDMHGNVWEWTSTAVGEDRVIRGGSWLNSAGLCEASCRYGNSPSDRSNRIGFRLCASGRAD